jgi:hypothetical protein
MPPASAASLLTIGASAAMLTARFGRPDLELAEHQARKLQFSGADCVLDLYLYPPRPGAEPVVTHADARRPDGAEMDREQCAAALSRPPLASGQR